MTRIVINLPPQPKQRPRVADGHAYTPSKTREYEQAVAYIAKPQIKRVLTGDIRATIHFYLAVPKSWQSAKKRLAREGKIRPSVTPDIDNLVKSILDALSGGIAYENDKQIVEMTAVKLYGDPRTEIMLEELN